MSVRPASRYLDNDTLTSLVSELGKQQELLQTLQKHLPDYLAQRCTHCLAKSGKLIIYVDSAAFASQLRFHIPTLLPAINQSSDVLFSCIQIRALLNKETAKANKAKANVSVRQNAGSHVLRAAEDCHTPEIKSALLRLGLALTKA